MVRVLVWLNIMAMNACAKCQGCIHILNYILVTNQLLTKSEFVVACSLVRCFSVLCCLAVFALKTVIFAKCEKTKLLSVHLVMWSHLYTSTKEITYEYFYQR